MEKYGETKNSAPEQLHQIRLVFKPDSALRYHREMVRLAMGSKSTRMTTTIHIHTKVWVSIFRYRNLGEIQKDQFDGEAFWEALSTIIPGNLKARFLAVDRIFAPFRGNS